MCGPAPILEWAVRSTPTLIPRDPIDPRHPRLPIRIWEPGCIDFLFLNLVARMFSITRIPFLGFWCFRKIDFFFYLCIEKWFFTKKINVISFVESGLTLEKGVFRKRASHFSFSKKSRETGHVFECVGPTPIVDQSKCMRALISLLFLFPYLVIMISAWSLAMYHLTLCLCTCDTVIVRPVCPGI